MPRPHALARRDRRQDNLPAHKGPRVEQLIKAAGAEVRYLPAYSPDMNPIEKAFSRPSLFASAAFDDAKILIQDEISLPYALRRQA